MSDEKYHVYQFFMDESYERVREFVSDEEAVKAAVHYSSSVGARMGTTVRVIICDMGDSVCYEWKYGEGIIFPPQEKP